MGLPTLDRVEDAPPASPGAGNAEPGRPSPHAPRAVGHGPATSASAAMGNAAWVMLARAVTAPTAKGGHAPGNANAGRSAARRSGTLLANRRQRRGREVKAGSSTRIADAGWHPCRQHGCPDAIRIVETKGWAPDRAPQETVAFRCRKSAAVPRDRHRRPSSAQRIFSCRVPFQATGMRSRPPHAFPTSSYRVNQMASPRTAPL